MSDDDEHSDDEIEDSLASQLQGSTNPKHFLEFVLNDHILPYNMTVYQAVQQHAQANLLEESDVDEDNGPFGRASIWTETHTVYYRPVSLVKDPPSPLSKRSKSDSCSSKSSIRSKSLTEKPSALGRFCYLEWSSPHVLKR